MINLNEINSTEVEETLNQLFHNSFNQKLAINNIPISVVIEVFSKLEALWSPGAKYYERAKSYLIENKHFSDEMNIMSLDIVSTLLNKESLQNRINKEFNEPTILDGLVDSLGYAGRTSYKPFGHLLQVTAGNVFLGCLDAIIMGRLTKNISLIKLSSQNTILPELFLESILEVDSETILSPFIHLLVWKGGDQFIEAFLKKKVNLIVTWGGESMAKSYMRDLSPNVKLIQHGPKISFHIITQEFLNECSSVFDDIVQDISLWDQSACANSQNIFLQSCINEADFKIKLASAFERFKLSRRTLGPDDNVEILKDKALAQYNQFLTGRSSICGSDYNILPSHNLLETTALNRTVKIKLFDDLNILAKELSAFSYYLQTCGLGVCISERSHYIDILSVAGVNRFTRIGEMLESLDGSPHDGSYPLKELMRVCADELRPNFNELKAQNVRKMPDKMPELITDSNSLEGIVYSSGGTTGKPKFAFYSYYEFQQIGKILGQSYIGNGVNPGDTVANLFMAANMWSSFSVIELALTEARAIQFPMGGNIDPDSFEQMVRQYNIKILFGLPSLLIKLASHIGKLKIDKIFYAGESFTPSGLKFIADRFGNPKIISAGYASVDIGPIGYQDPSCGIDEHILFSELVELKIVNGEGVVSSKVRMKMPIINVHTGDKIEMIEKNIDDSSGKIRFRLLGRVDKKINIWSSKFELSDFQKIINLLGENTQFQIELSTKILPKEHYEQMTVKISHKLGTNLSDNEFKRMIYNNLKDVKDTHPETYITDKIIICEKCEFSLNPKTGKATQIIDLRK